MKHFTRSGIVIKNYRNKLGLTQREIAAEYGMHSQFWSNNERGICLLPVPAMRDIYNRADFPRASFDAALKEDLFESHIAKYKPTGQRRKRAPKSKALGTFGINV